MRGSRALYKELITDIDSKVLFPAVSAVKGRSKELIEQRNLCLIYRYCYYTRLHGCKYEETLSKLAKEFYLSPRTIIDVIAESKDMIKKAREEVKNLTTLKQMFPYMVWEPQKKGTNN